MVLLWIWAGTSIAETYTNLQQSCQGSRPSQIVSAMRYWFQPAKTSVVSQTNTFNSFPLNTRTNTEGEKDRFRVREILSTVAHRKINRICSRAVDKRQRNKFHAQVLQINTHSPYDFRYSHVLSGPKRKQTNDNGKNDPNYCWLRSVFFCTFVIDSVLLCFSFVWLQAVIGLTPPIKWISVRCVYESGTVKTGSAFATMKYDYFYLSTAKRFGFYCESSRKWKFNI